MCSKGQIAIPTVEGIKCTDPPPDDTVVCKDGQLPKETISGRFCQDGQAPVETTSGWICADGQVSVEMKSTICASPDSKDGRITALGNSCDEDQVLTNKFHPAV